MTANYQQPIQTSVERKLYPIPGGVHPPQNKTQSTQTPLTKAPLPKQVCLPLNQHIGAPSVPIVAIGDRVVTGQVIARAKGVVSAPVHASISGTVSAIEDRILPHPSGMSGPCIVIESDGLDEWLPCAEDPDFMAASTQALTTKIAEAGIIGLGGAGFPTAVKLSSPTPIEHLIINGTECEPYITADDMLMRSQPEDIIQGCLVLAKILGNPADVVIGMEDNKPEAFEALRDAAKGTRIQVVKFPCQYPSGGEKQLIQRLTGKEVPSGGLPAQVGCVVQNIGTAYAVLQAVKYNRPLVSRVTTVVGQSLAQSGNVWVRMGTPVADLLDHFGCQAERCQQLIMGGPMMGFALSDAQVPVVKTTNCIIAPTAQEMPPAPPAQACIRCGMCDQACPAGLLPQQLYWYARAEEFEKLENHNLFDCIECGACSYTCPSRIPLVQYYRSAKGEIRQQRDDKVKADRSRQRFEFRQARLAKAAAEKEAKRLARQKAAEAAKAKQAQKTTAPTVEPSVHESGDQQAKLERALASAQSRLSSAQQRFDSAQIENSDRLDQFAAALKQAQVRVDDAKLKLSQIETKDNAAGSSSSAAPADDPIANAIARAQAKHAMSPREKAEADIASLQKRLDKARDRLQGAEADNLDTVSALRLGVEKLETKLLQAKSSLEQLAPATDTEQQTTVAPADPAQAAIERAKANAAKAAQMSPGEKLTHQISSLEKRLSKAEAKLAQAQSDNSDTQEALATGVSKLQEKLRQAKTELSQLNES